MFCPYRWKYNQCFRFVFFSVLFQDKTFFAICYTFTVVELKNLPEYDKMPAGATVLRGELTFILKGMEVMSMKNHYDFEDLMAFGLFLLALLTFVFTFCR